MCVSSINQGATAAVSGVACRWSEDMKLALPQIDWCHAVSPPAAQTYVTGDLAQSSTISFRRFDEVIHATVGSEREGGKKGGAKLKGV